MYKFFFLSLLLAACAGGSSIPKDVLPPERLGPVLYDVIRADELVDYLQNTDSSFRRFAKRASLYDTIFQLHAIKKEDFRKSLQYYQGHPDLLKIVLDSLQKKASVPVNPPAAPLVK